MTAAPDDIADCDSQSDAARWLLRCPLAKLQRDEARIRQWLRLTRFEAGIAYLDAELFFVRSNRSADGGPADLLAITVARGRMDRIACGLTPRNYLGA